MAVEDCLPENIKQNKVTFVCLFVDAAPTLIIDKTRPKISQHALLVTPCDRLTANHTLGHSSTKELFSPLSQVGLVLESAEPAWAEEGRRAYHAFSRLRSKGKIKQNFIECRCAYHALLRVIHIQLIWPSTAKEIDKGSTDPEIN